MLRKNCIECGKEFYAKTRKDTSKNKFCSDLCFCFSKKKKSIVRKNCIRKSCGKSFIVKSPGQVFCSGECNRLSRSKLKTQKPLVREYFLERANFTCQKCGLQEVSLELHHFIPISKGGEDSPENIVVWCMGCHMSGHGIFGF